MDENAQFFVCARIQVYGFGRLLLVAAIRLQGNE
jgi:hypothetical protein